MHDSFVTAKCCQVGKNFIRLSYGHRLYAFDGDLDGYTKMAETEAPLWKMSARCLNNGFGKPHIPEDLTVIACPACGEALPPVRRRASAHTPKKITVIIDGGYYCYTCGKRLMGCKCVGPEKLWEAVPNKP